MVEHSALSDRELQILRLVATGAGNKEIANQLSISTNTVKVHLRNIFDKIQVNSRTEAAMYAVQQGLVGEKPVKPTDSLFDSNPPLPIPLYSQIENPTFDLKLPSKPQKPRFLQKIVWWSIGISLVLLSVLSGYLLTQQINPGAEESGYDSTCWEQLPELKDRREGLALAVQSNQLFAIAGNNESGVTDQVTVLPLEGGAWEFRQPKPVPVSDIQAGTISGFIYVPGGMDASGTVVDDLDIYNPTIDAWSKGSPLPEARCRYSLVAVEGKLYLFGGWDGNEYKDDTYVYDPVEDLWTELTPMATPRAWTGGAFSGSRIYIFGGVNADGISDQIAIFTPPNTNQPYGTWTQTSPLPMKRYAFGATSLADLIFIVGGRGEEETTLPNLIYYPEIQEWRSFVSPFPEGVIKQGFTGAGTHLYVVGGELGSEIQNLAYAYQAFFTASLPIVR